MCNSSNIGHETSHIWRIAPRGMRSTSPARILGSRIPILWYLYLVRCFEEEESEIAWPLSVDRSQTSWVWLETKLVELGMLGGTHNYQVKGYQPFLFDVCWYIFWLCCLRYRLVRAVESLCDIYTYWSIIQVLDKTCMFTVFSNKEGRPHKHSVKALQIIWNHFPQLWVRLGWPYGLDLFFFSGARNTIHIDDLVRVLLSLCQTGIFNVIQGRNFALNPNQGLKISPFKDAHTPQAMADRELDRVARYMVHIANAHSDFTSINHKVSERPPSWISASISISHLNS